MPTIFLVAKDPISNQVKTSFFKTSSKSKTEEEVPKVFGWDSLIPSWNKAGMKDAYSYVHFKSGKSLPSLRFEKRASIFKSDFSEGKIEKVVVPATEKDRFWQTQVSRKIPERIPKEQKHLWEQYIEVVSSRPEKYVRSVPVYENLLKDGFSKRNILAARDYTGTTAEENRVRWALQSSLLLYEIDFGSVAIKADQSTNFLYEWHETAFQFGGGVSTVGKAAWEIMRTMPVADVSRAVGYDEFVADTIKYFNPPSGVHPSRFPNPPNWLLLENPQLWMRWKVLREVVAPKDIRRGIDWFSDATDKFYK